MEDGFDRLKVAAISMKPEKWNKDANAIKIEKLFRKAATLGAKVAVISEGSLEGMVVMDVIRKPESASRLLEIAEPLDGKYIDRFRKLAQNIGTCFCLSFAERLDREVYNSAIFIDNEGAIRGVHHKMQFAEGYHDSWYFNRLGSQIRAFDTPFGRAGFLICNDRWDSLLARALVLDGARVIYIPAYGSRKLRQDRMVLSIARDNGVPVVEANVGVNLIISRGEILSKERGDDRVTIAEIEIPFLPSETLARKIESEFISRRKNEMEKKYKETMTSVRRRRLLLSK